MSGNGGPWGGGGGGNGDDREGRERGERDPARGGPRRPGDTPGMSQIDDLVKSGQERLRVLMGGRGGSGNGRGPSGGPRGPEGPLVTRQGLALGAVAAVLLWSWMSFYSVKPEERSVELFLGKRAQVGEPGLNFAPWPIVTYEKVQAGVQQTTRVGLGSSGNRPNAGFMLTRDQNIIDMGVDVIWNISNPEDYLFNIASPEDTLLAVSESAMRDIIARSEMLPAMNRDRARIAIDMREAIQVTLDSYDAGINVVRVNLDRTDAPPTVADAFREVQSAQQQRSTFQSQADAYANQVTAAARGQAAALLEEAEAYRAKVVNDAQGEAAAFLSVYAEYVKAPEVTRQRLYLETMERVLGGMNKVILDGVGGDEAGQGVVPFLPLNELGRMAPAGAAATTGGSN
jgi:modulator of FtsH protease HflK